MVDTAAKAPSQGQSRADNLGLIFSAPVSYTHLTLPTILLV